MLRQTLEQMGHTVAEARDGREGLAEHLTATRPTLVLTDLIMPDKEGIETISELLRQTFSRTPDHRHVRRRPQQRPPATCGPRELVGAHHLLAKPFTQEELGGGTGSRRCCPGA
jgi:CheY-like chemotaxis protein